MQIIYMDNAASTRVDPRVLDAMLPYFCDCYANASALHQPAQRAKAAVEKARDVVARVLGAQDCSEVIFTSGATEGNNTVLGTFKGHIVISSIEHPSVLNPCIESGRCHTIPVDKHGTVDIERYAAMLKEHKPELVSVMLVNNELGCVQDIDKIGEMARDAGAKFHTDLTQGIGKCDMNLGDRPVDYATLSGHKFHAPKGVGAVWARTGAPLTRFQIGGTHEAFRRAGTLNVPGIVGLGKALEIIEQEGKEDLSRIRAVRERLLAGLLAIPDSQLNGQPDGAPHIISVSYRGVEGEAVIINLDSKGICCTAGSACSSGMHLKSAVLTAIGLPDEWLRGTIRFSLGRFNTEAEAEIVVQAVSEAVSMVRAVGEFAAN